PLRGFDLSREKIVRGERDAEQGHKRRDGPSVHGRGGTIRIHAPGGHGVLVLSHYALEARTGGRRGTFLRADETRCPAETRRPPAGELPEAALKHFARA